MTIRIQVTNDIMSFDAAAFEEFLAARHEPDWIVQPRRDAFAVYQDLLKKPLPTEEFQRVDVRALQPDQYHCAGPRSAKGAANVGGRSPLVTLMQDRA